MADLKSIPRPVEVAFYELQTCMDQMRSLTDIAFSSERSESLLVLARYLMERTTVVFDQFDGALVQYGFPTLDERTAGVQPARVDHGSEAPT